MIDEGISKLI